MTDCPHGMPTPASCMPCMEEGNMPPVVVADPDHIVATFYAKYDGECPGCGLSISVGQTVHKLEPSGRYVHEGCQP